MNMSDDLRKVLLIGIGALAITGEKAIEMVDALSAKGALTMEQGKALNQELRRSVKNTLNCQEGADCAADDATPGAAPSFAQMLAEIDSLTPEEIATLEERLASRKSAQ